MNGGDDASCSKSGSGMEGNVWETFQKSFSQVQAILDQNRILIREINQNHESKVPTNLARNVSLIRELNSNIARVVELYANLSADFVQSVMDNSSRNEEAADCIMKMEKEGASTPPQKGQKKARHA